LPRNLYITARIHFIMSPGFLYLEVNLSSMCFKSPLRKGELKSSSLYANCAGEAIYSGINCAFEIFRKKVLQTVPAAKRFSKSFYESAIYDGGQSI